MKTASSQNPLAREKTSRKNTVVRFLSELNGKGVYWAFQALDVAAPEIGAVWAEKIFLKPPHHRPPEAERKVLESARSFWVESGDRKVAAWSWNHGEGRRNIYLMHGWGGRGGQLYTFVHPLVDAGFSVIAFDAPAHGQSPGETSNALEFSKALMAVVRSAGPAYAVIAHSLGAAVTTYSMKKGLKVPKAIFIGAPRGGEDFTRPLREQLGVSQKIIGKMRRRIEKRSGVRWAEFDTTTPCSQDTRVFVIHDREDREVSWKSGQAIADGWPRSQMVLTSGLGHRRVLRSPDVIQKVVDFLSG